MFQPQNPACGDKPFKQAIRLIVQTLINVTKIAQHHVNVN